MFKEVIKEVLEKEERSQAWLARHTGIPEASISIYLRTGTRMSIARVEKIFEFLGIKVAGKTEDLKHE